MNAYQGCELFSMKPDCNICLSLHSKQVITRKSQKQLPRLKKNISGFYKDYNGPTDNKSTKAMLKLYRADVPAKFHPDFYANVVDKKFKGDIDKFVDDMFAKTVFASEAKLMAFLDKPVLKTIEKIRYILHLPQLIKYWLMYQKDQVSLIPDLQQEKDSGLQPLWRWLLKKHSIPMQTQPCV